MSQLKRGFCSSDKYYLIYEMEGNKKSTGEGADLKLVELHRNKRPAMVRLAQEFANELSVICSKYNSQLKSHYSMIITSQDFKEGAEINNIYKVVLLDQYYPENGYSPINLQ